MKFQPSQTPSNEKLCIYKRVHPKGYKSWLVIIRLGSGKKIDKTFSFLKYGGEDAAYQAARRFRDEMVIEHPPLNRDSRQVVGNRNTSGYAGVYKRSSGKQTYWVAKTQKHDGKSLRKSFNVGMLGDEQALALAIEERQQQLKQIANRQYRHTCRERLYLELSSGQDTVQSNEAV